MKVIKFKHERNPKEGATVQYAFVRFSINGCGLNGCNCSPERYLSFSGGPGTTGVSVEFTEAEVKKFITAVKRGQLDMELR